MLSHKYMFADKYGIKVGVVKTLVPNLCNKSKYVIHYRNLQLHLTFGVKMNKVQTILKSDWLKNTLILIWTKEKCS